MKEDVTKIIDTLAQEDFHWAFQKLLERYNKCIAVGDYIVGNLSFMCVLSRKVSIRKKSQETYLMILVYNKIWQGHVLHGGIEELLRDDIVENEVFHDYSSK